MWLAVVKTPTPTCLLTATMTPGLLPSTFTLPGADGPSLQGHQEPGKEHLPEGCCPARGRGGGALLWKGMRPGHHEARVEPCRAAVAGEEMTSFLSTIDPVPFL